AVLCHDRPMGSTQPDSPTRPAMSRRLVLTADDLGHDRETNREIVALLREGRLTASALLVVGPEAEHAAGLVLAAQMDDDGASPAGRVPVPRLHVALTSPAG